MLAGSFSLTAPTVALAEPLDSLEITGDGVTAPVVLTLPQLKAMEQYEHVYSTINTWPTKKWYRGKGVKLRDLLGLAGIKGEATLIRFESKDGYAVTFTVKELLSDKRYYFPGLKDNHPSDGSIPGSPEGAQEVEPILALLSAEDSDNPAQMNDRDALLLLFGQRAVTEQTNNLFLKYTKKIEVLTTPPEKWDSPKASIPSGTVLPVGTRITLSNKGNNEDKIYYTTDGSTPTVNSPMFNWSASRWWPLRGNLDSVNKPIEVKKDTVIKAITIGPGKLDSDVVTFTFTVDPTGKVVDPTKVPGGPPTGVTLDRNTINLKVGGTFQLAATIAPYNATDRRVTWSSSDTRVATVDNNGLVTVVGPGTAIITATTIAGNHTATCVVNARNEDDDSRVAVPAAGTGFPENEAPEEPGEPPVPEAVQQYLAEKESAVPRPTTADAPRDAPAQPPVPEGKGQYLAEKKDGAAVSAAADASSGQPGSQSWRVFEVSAATVPLPLQEQPNRLGIYAAMIFLNLFLYGASKKYAEYAKEL